ncbi:MAG TPA: TetR/AcrR family transcriptional regulator, partial [Chloroflexota bacterium]|nr:TetR/AcrR family transcriptional regulator [Chloroflexota bacterium]
MNETDRRVKRTRKLLQDAFLALMAEKSLQAITVQDIAERADVNRATFYAHFVDKYALLDHVVGEWTRQTLARRVSPESPFTQGHLYALIVAVLEGLAEFHGRCKPSDRDLGPLIEARVQSELEGFLSDWLARAATTEVESRVSRATAATVLSWAIFGAGIAWSRGTSKVSAEEMAREVLALFSGGIGRLVKESSRVSRASNGLA